MINDFEQLLRTELERLDADEQAIRDLVDTKQAARMQQGIAKTRRRIEKALEQLPARREAADSQRRELLNSVIHALEKHVDGA